VSLKNKFLLSLAFFSLLILLAFCWLFISLPKLSSTGNILFILQEKDSQDRQIWLAYFDKNKEDFHLEKINFLLPTANFAESLFLSIDRVVTLNKELSMGSVIDLIELSVANRDWSLFKFLVFKQRQEIIWEQIDSPEAWQKSLSQIKKIYENCPVAVVNNSDELGLAQKFSQIWENSGVSVIRVTNNFNQQETASRIDLISDTDCQLTLSKILATLPSGIEISRDQQALDQYRAKMVVFLNLASEPTQ